MKRIDDLALEPFELYFGPSKAVLVCPGDHFTALKRYLHEQRIGFKKVPGTFGSARNPTYELVFWKEHPPRELARLIESFRKNLET